MQQKIMMQTIQRYVSLRDQGRLILDAARLGNRIKVMIPCLDPRLQDEVTDLNLRYDMKDERLLYVSHLRHPNDLAKEAPFFVDFYPST